MVKLFSPLFEQQIGNFCSIFFAIFGNFFKIGNIRTSCPLYRKQIKNLNQIIDKIGNNWTKVVLIWMLKVAKNGKKRWTKVANFGNWLAILHANSCNKVYLYIAHQSIFDMVNLAVNFSWAHGSINMGFVTMTTTMFPKSVNKNNLLSW